MTKKKTPSTPKSSANKQTLQNGKPNMETQNNLSPGDPSDQDAKRRRGQFNGAGEPSLQLMGSRGRNQKPKKKQMGIGARR